MIAPGREVVYLDHSLIGDGLGEPPSARNRQKHFCRFRALADADIHEFRSGHGVPSISTNRLQSCHRCGKQFFRDSSRGLSGCIKRFYITFVDKVADESFDLLELTEVSDGLRHSIMFVDDVSGRARTASPASVPIPNDTIAVERMPARARLDVTAAMSAQPCYRRNVSP